MQDVNCSSKKIILKQKKFFELKKQKILSIFAFKILKSIKTFLQKNNKNHKNDAVSLANKGIPYQARNDIKVIIEFLEVYIYCCSL